VSASEVIIPQHVGARHGGRILRYTFAERLNHWIAALAYIYCLITGLAFWSPYMFWLSYFVGGGPTARYWHPWAGLVFTVSVLWMFKIWLADMRITDADRTWAKAMKYYIRNEDEDLPSIWKFNYGQKLFFWVMFYGAILLVLSGILLWVVESVPWSLRWLRYTGVAVHVTVALLTIGAFIIHVYMGTAMVRGGFSSIVRGEVTDDWARMHHRLWYEKGSSENR
jgi:formate dehydrogenase subunit gamma